MCVKIQCLSDIIPASVRNSVSGVSRVYLGLVLGVSQVYLGSILSLSWAYLGRILCFCCILSVFWAKYQKLNDKRMNDSMW